MAEIVPLAQMTSITAKTAMPSASIPKEIPSQTLPIVPTEEPKSEVPRETKLEGDPRLANYAKREKDLRAIQKQIQAEKKELEERFKPWQELSQLAQVNKLEALKRLGLSYDQLTNMMLESSETPKSTEPTAQEIVDQKLQAYDKRQQEAQIAQQQKAYDQALQQIGLEAKSIVERSQDFPLVKHTQAFDTVVALIEHTFHESGRVMPVDEAVKEVKQYLEETTLEIAKTEKIRSKLLQQEEPKQEPVPTQANSQQTLTHNKTVAPAGAKPMSFAERRARAENVFYGRTV